MDMFGEITDANNKYRILYQIVKRININSNEDMELLWIVLQTSHFDIEDEESFFLVWKIQKIKSPVCGR